MMQARNTTRRTALFLSLVIGHWSLVIDRALAQYRESFESPDHVWQLANADCGVRVIKQQRTFEQAHEGSSSEHLRLVAGQGTHLYYTFDLGRAPIIDETNFSLWLKADKARLQLLARVVLPRTLDERTGKPITALMQGDEYGEVGSWQKLQVKDLKKLLARQTVVLRKQFGPHVDPGEAYIDLLVLNAYGGPGEANLWIDDLEVLGVVDSEWAKDIAPKKVGDNETNRSAARPALVDGNVLLVENRPLLVRAIEHRGEPLEVIKAVGFNTVYLATSPTQELNDEANRLGLWLIAPPPDFGADSGAAAKLDRVITWQLGHDLSGSELPDTRKLVAELRAADRLLRRPLLATIKNDAWSYGREVDVLGWQMPPLFGPRSPADSSAALRIVSSTARVGTPVWAKVPLGPPPELIDQLSLLDSAAPTTLAPDLEQARLAMLSALAGGARGLIIQSSTRIDGEDETSQHLATVLRLLNLELNLIEPWFAGGSAPLELRTGDPTLKATILQTERSRLVVLLREQVLGQFVTPPAGADTMQLSLPGVPTSDRFYHLTADGLQPLDRPLGNAGTRIVVPEAGHSALVAVTQDPLVIQHLQRTSAAQRQQAVETRLRLASNRLSSTALVGEELRPTLPPPRDGVAKLREAQRFLQEADQLLIRKDLTGCFRNTRRVESLVTQVRREWWDAARGSFLSPLSSPCCVTFDTLPAHVRLGFRLQQGTWTKNGLPAGDCEQLDQLLATGWKQQRHELPDVQASVELSTHQPHGGTSCIRLAAQPQAKRDFLFDGPAVSISTGSILVREGQVARLHGFVRVPEPLRGTCSSLLIYDNFAGPAVAESVVHAPAWREFTLYRAIPRDGELSITFALAGIGEAAIDDVSIVLVSPAEPSTE
jgi:hypothetical protein